MIKTVKTSILIITILFAPTEQIEGVAGVGLYVSNNLNYKIRTDLNIHEEGIIECLFIEIISATSKNTIIGNICRPCTN